MLFATMYLPPDWVEVSLKTGNIFLGRIAVTGSQRRKMGQGSWQETAMRMRRFEFAVVC
jgi:hypothetical protein